MLRKICIGFGLFWSLSALPALGQVQNDPAAAQAKYEEAEKYYKLGEFGAALPLYREAYLMSGEPELLFNIGQCNRQLGFNEEALKNYKVYLRDVPDSPSRETVERLIQEVEAKIAAASQPTTQPESTSTSAPAVTIEQRPPMTPAYLWKNRPLVKGGAIGAGAGIGLGITALVLAKGAQDNLVSTSKQQERVNTFARSADLVVIASAVCVAVGIFQEVHHRSLGPNAKLLLEIKHDQVLVGVEF